MTHNTSIITKPDDAHNHEYIVLGRSLAGKYVNIGYTPSKSVMSNRHYWYKVLTDHYIDPVNDYLGQSNDTLEATLLVANTVASNEIFNNTLHHSASFKYQPANDPKRFYAPDHAKRWPIYSTSQTHFNQVTELDQLILDPDSTEAHIKYGKQRWHSHLVTVFTQSRQHHVFACNAYSSLGLIESYIKEWGKRPDPILWIMLSTKENAPHLAIIKELLDPQGQVTYGHLARFINPPSTINNTRQQNLDTKQLGYTKLPFVLMLMIGILLLGLSSCHGLAYTTNLSKNVSGQASRNLLAFFVPVIDTDSQSLSKYTGTAPEAHISATREHSLISMANHLPTSYDGLTLQNIIAERRICRAVTNVTESKTRHPIPSSYSVASTQKTLGDSYHG
ncbi:hypothetical protein [Psychrobacter aquimaris]|uniref:hypothetical protein n=1 Tax=Psychrobacter aquimaris TaxID=292733 RepID=UPI0018DEF6CF|nr:hypothetical protein [Psychrobacter aquimaris]